MAWTEVATVVRRFLPSMPRRRVGPSVLLLTALAVGQAAPPEEPKPAPPPPDRWPLMLALQGTYPGWLLDGNKLQLYGWVDSAFTASTVRHDQLPMGFNYRANEFHVQQAWVRFERPVDQNAATPTFGFRSDTFAGHRLSLHDRPRPVRRPTDRQQRRAGHLRRRPGSVLRRGLLPADRPRAGREARPLLRPVRRTRASTRRSTPFVSRSTTSSTTRSRTPDC